MKDFMIEDLDLEHLEETLNPLDPADRRLIQKRIIDTVRTAQAARKAAELARKNNNEELAQKLEARATELEELAKNAYIDTLDDEEQQNDQEGGKDDSEDDTENGDDTDEDEDSEDDDGSDDELEDETDDEESDDSEDDSDSDDENPFDDTDSPESEDDQDSSDMDGSEDDSDDDSSSDDEMDDSEADDSEADDSDEDDSEDNPEDHSDEEDNEDTDELEDEDTDKSEEDEEDKDTSDGDSDKDTDEEESDEEETDETGDSDESESDESDDSSEDDDTADNGSQDDEQEEDEDEDEEEESDDAPVKDPFADDEDIPQLNPQGPDGQEPRDATLDDIIKELRGLKGEARKGALAALNDIKINRGSGEKKESLHESLLAEAKKNLRELDEDEYADLINDTLDMIDQAGEELTYDDDGESRKERVKEIGNDPTLRRELTKEISDAAVKDHQEVKAREQELNKYKNCKTIEDFILNLYNTINNEVTWVKRNKKTWNEINNDYEDEDILVKSNVTKKHLEESVPVIDFYFDCSGSWTGYPEAIKIGRRAVATVKEFADSDLIKLNVYYFGRNSLSSDMNAVWGGGTQCWEQIIKNIKKTGATNVVLMTDGDMEGQASWGKGVRVEGAVWFIWGLGGSTGPGYSEQGHEIPKKLIGTGNNTHYAFDVKKQ